MTKTIEMQLTKSTKGTYVYGNTDDDTPVPTLYVRKSGLPNPPPQTIEVIINVK